MVWPKNRRGPDGLISGTTAKQGPWVTFRVRVSRNFAVYAVSLRFTNTQDGETVVSWAQQLWYKEIVMENKGNV